MDDDDNQYLVGIFSGFAPYGTCKQTSTSLGSNFTNYYKVPAKCHLPCLLVRPVITCPVDTTKGNFDATRPVISLKNTTP